MTVTAASAWMVTRPQIRPKRDVLVQRPLKAAISQLRREDSNLTATATVGSALPKLLCGLTREPGQNRHVATQLHSPAS